MLRTREAVVVVVIYDGDVPDTGFDWRMNFVGKEWLTTTLFLCDKFVSFVRVS